MVALETGGDPIGPLHLPEPSDTVIQWWLIACATVPAITILVAFGRNLCTSVGRQFGPLVKRLRRFVRSKVGHEVWCCLEAADKVPTHDRSSDSYDSRIDRGFTDSGVAQEAQSPCRQDGTV